MGDISSEDIKKFREDRRMVNVQLNPPDGTLYLGVIRYVKPDCLVLSVFGDLNSEVTLFYRDIRSVSEAEVEESLNKMFKILFDRGWNQDRLVDFAKKAWVERDY